MSIQHHYIEKGDGFPMILLHGNGEDNQYFEHQIQYFSKFYRVIALDTRGHGKTARGEQVFTLEQFAEDLKGFLDGKNISKAILLGFSDGGNIALLFTIKYQGYVRALILDGANLYPAGLKALARIPIKIGYGCCSLLARIDKRWIGKAEMLKLMSHQPNIVPELLGAVTIPVLVMAGTRDVIKKSHTDEIYRSLPNARLAILKGGHFIAAKCPGVFNQKVHKFLKLSENE